MTDRPWHTAPICALDLEGTGAQDGEHEAILEVALVPFTGAVPAIGDAFGSLVNPERPVPHRSWISPGLTDAALADAPRWDAIASVVAETLSGRWLVGHNVRVDWRLISRHVPGLEVAGLLDTYRLARASGVPGKLGLVAVIRETRLGDAVQAAVPDGQPHRALWDTVAAALLLPVLVARLWPDAAPTIGEVAECSESGQAPGRADTLF